MNADFKGLTELYNDSNFSEILNFDNGLYFLKLRSMSRSKIIEKFCTENSIVIPDKKTSFKFLVEKNMSEQIIEKFIREEFKTGIKQEEKDFLYSQLYKLDVLDWGGLYQNGLEKTIVNNYVKRIMNYDTLNEKIDGELHASMGGYVKASWYNNWTAVLIEDMFKTHHNVLPAIGWVKNLDFFWHDVPFDLKTTYFPSGFMTAIRREQNLKPELSELKRFAKEHGIYFASDASDRVVFREIYKKIEESNQDVCKEFMTRFKQTRNDMIDSAIRNPRKLATWLYEEQGERRFDAVYRIYLILIDRCDLDYSWKLKRNSDYLPEKISEFLDGDLKDEIISINFKWKERDYATKCCILFIER